MTVPSPDRPAAEPTAVLRTWISDGIGEILDEDPSGFLLGVESVTALELLDALVGRLTEAEKALAWYDEHKANDGSYDGGLFGDLSDRFGSGNTERA